ncbi:MAG: type II toxin-antitoxin system VapC family toxin [Pseudomonadota bacterium]|uniref:PIN domain-containing protein n=1 Tax=hydrothermal vent metagenome TaxID=652676 RepID=A0A160TH16_9ZZZZ
MILLDTHVLLWLVEGGKSLGAKARKRIEADVGDVHLSAMSFWEIAMLADKRRIALSMPQTQWTERLLGLGHFKVAPVDAAIAGDAGALPGDIHGDPCDRLIVATARWLGCPLLTVDRHILDYADKGHVEAIDAGR